VFVEESNSVPTEERKQNEEGMNTRASVMKFQATLATGRSFASTLNPEYANLDPLRRNFSSEEGFRTKSRKRKTSSFTLSHPMDDFFQAPRYCHRKKSLIVSPHDPSLSGVPAI
jgi:hypothetical protein